jgi:hypothetical protein
MGMATETTKGGKSKSKPTSTQGNERGKVPRAGRAAPKTRTVAPRIRRVSWWRSLTGRRKMAAALGGVGVAVLGLSVFHCTEAIAVLTGSHAVLACLLSLI